jgi:glucokinase
MILAIDLGGTNVRLGQVNEGKVIRQISVASPSKLSLENSLDYLKAEISKLMTSDIKAIGFGVPSVVDASRGIVYNATNIPSWREVHLKDYFSDVFSLPVYVNNDCNCFVLGEKTYGVGKPYKNIVGITLGTGVGSGLIINNELYNGRNTGAGEIGSLPYLADATFEDYCSSMFFSNYYQITGEEAAKKANEGDISSLEIWKIFGVHIGKLMQTVLYVYDPELIILGGGISKAYPLFATEMQKTMMQFPYPETVKNVKIEISTTKDISLLGASALANPNKE